METPLVSMCLVSGGKGRPHTEADLRSTIAAPVHAPRMRVPAGSGFCSIPCPRALIRLGLSPRQVPTRVVLTPRWPLWVLALISADTAARRNHVGLWVSATTGTGTCGWEL